MESPPGSRRRTSLVSAANGQLGLRLLPRSGNRPLLRTGWHYPNIETLGHISSELYRGNCTGRSGPCIGQSDPGDWHDAEYSLNFGTWANR